jgi:four helix bundle protein
MQASRYQGLIAWQKAIGFVKEVYGLTARFPQDEMFGLRSQMRRSAVSVPSNIAEGQGRSTAGEFQQFLGHARGSLYELETQIVIASELNYVSLEDCKGLLKKSSELGRILNGLISSVKARLPKSAARAGVLSKEN